MSLSSPKITSETDGSPNRTGWTAARIGWSAYIVPFLFVFSPSLLMHGDPFTIAWAAFTAGLGVWMGTIGVVGYYSAPISAPIAGAA